MIDVERILSHLRPKLSGGLKLTFGESVEIASDLRCRVSDIVIAEAVLSTGESPEEIFKKLEDSFDHNLMALEIGLSSGVSPLLGSIGMELANKEHFLMKDAVIDKALIYTLATQVGNHEIGLRPCAGTGDVCPYTGLFKAMKESTSDRETVLRSAAVMLKIGTIFRVGKTTVGCNMEGYGAGAAVTAAALTEFRGGKPKEIGDALVLALSPTLGVPCTPQVVVAGLCATHIGGAIIIGALASSLILDGKLTIDVEPDVMINLASKIHLISAEKINPSVIESLTPFFKRNPEVEPYIKEEIKERDEVASIRIKQESRKKMRELAKLANPITAPFGEVVVGGSSLTVGSPANTGRIAHFLSHGKIRKIRVRLCPELFARRSISIPGILMGALYGCSTSDAKSYKMVMDDIASRKIEVDIEAVDEPQVQRVEITTDESEIMVNALNRGGGRLKLVEAVPSLEKAREVANRLGIDLVD